MQYLRVLLVGMSVLAGAADFGGAQTGQGQTAPATFGARVYVPYADLARAVEPADKTVLMDRAAFEALLAEAEARTAESPVRALGHIMRADYTGEVSQMRYLFSGTLEAASLSDRPAPVPFMFAGAGLSKVLLDGVPAPLGYDKDGRLVLILTSRGRHKVSVEGACKLTELENGGMRFGMTLPEATAGTMVVRLVGDMEVHATAPTASRLYDKAADATEVTLTIGGKSDLAVVLLGNGRQDDDRAILLGESAASVQLSARQQTLSCMYTVQVLRRGVRDLMFELPSGWTVTEVSCPSMVKWTVVQEEGLDVLAVRLRSAKTGTVALHIKSLAELGEGSWRGPRITLREAAFQRGYLLVSTDEGIGLRGERLVDALREDVAATSRVPGLAGLSMGQLYSHWGPRWSVQLEPAAIELSRTVKGNQRVEVLTDQVRLTGDFEATAVDRPMYDVTFSIAGAQERWDIEAVTVDGQETGFDYRLEPQGARQALHIAFSRPVRPEKVANVRVVLRHVPSDWKWDETTQGRRGISVPLIESQGDNVSGLVAVVAAGDLDVERPRVDARLEPVGVGRMAGLGLSQDVRYAYRYEEAIGSRIEMDVVRRNARIGATGSGLIIARPEGISGCWRLIYTISRASTKKLYFLADKSLGPQIYVQSQSVRFSARQIVEPGEQTIALSSELAARYNLWMLDLDDKRIGEVIVDVSYEQPLKERRFRAALVRPICADGVSEQLAIQASEELALDVNATGATEIDAVDLEALPIAASRILAAYRLAAADGGEANASFEISTKVHENYAVPAALAVWARMTTYVDVCGGQRTEAVFGVVNAGRQFLTMRLPAGAELWSLAVGSEQARPQRSVSGDYQVAIGRWRQPVAVKVVYAWRPEQADLAALRVGGVELVEIEVNELQWNLVAPPGYEVYSQQTKLEMQGAVRARPAFLGVWQAVRLANWEIGCASTVSKSRLMLSMDGGSQASYDYAGEAVQTQPAEPAMVQTAAGPQAPPPPALSQAAAPQRPSPKPKIQAKESKIQTAAPGKQIAARGRYTLPVTLVASGGSGAAFRGLGAGQLVVSLKKRSRLETWGWLGLMAAMLAGAFMLLRPARQRVIFVVAVLFGSSLVSVWVPCVIDFANGLFAGAAAFVGLYPAVWLARLVGRRLRLCEGAAGRTAATAMLAVATLLLCCGGAPAAEAQSPATANGPAVVVPYTGDATEIAAGAKVLVSYARYVELWNQAHPDDPIDSPTPESDLAFSDVRYEVEVNRQRVDVVLSADVRTYGRQWVTIGMPFANVAVTEARFANDRANLQSGPAGMVLMLPGSAKGKLEIRLATEPRYVGPRGSVAFSLAPLPGAVMRVRLTEGADLQFEAEGIDGVLTKTTEGDGVVWVAPVSMKRDIMLRWQPKVADSSVDRTLSAVSDHEVHVFHWAIVGVTKIAYDLSAGQHDQFHLLMPEGAMLTDLAGANVRDVRQAGRRSVEGYAFDVLQVNLHRPAKQRYEMTVRWIQDVKVGKGAERLLLVRPDGVGRESGSVILHAAGGMTVKAAGVEGGRRMELAAGPAGSAHEAQAVAKYYWPYRPFALFVEVSRPVIAPEVKLDQLVRISCDAVELLAEARLQTNEKRLFGAVFELPDGYELLSLAGPAVERYYESRAGEDGARRLYVKFAGAESKTQVAMVMVSRGAPAMGKENFAAPLLTCVDEAAVVGKAKSGRVAVQTARSLDARTVSSKVLKPISPASLADWLTGEQMKAVQFAYTYEGDQPSLVLNVRPLPSKVRLETFAGLNVRPTAATYTYRLRYMISGSPVDRLAFSMDSAAAALSVVESGAIRSIARQPGADGRTTWELSLVNEVTGAVDVAVNLSQPVDAGTKELIVPRIDGVGVEEVRTVVAVQNMSRHEIGVRDGDVSNLAVLPYSEQQKLIPAGMQQSLQYVFQTFDPEWSLRLAFSPAKEAARIQAVADLLAMTTVIDRAGRSCYEVKVSLQNRSEQYLRVRVPEGLRLWSANVAEQPVKPVVDAEAAAGQVLIPLVKTSPGGLPYDVVMYFAGTAVQPLDGATRLRPPSIEILGLPVMQTTWSLRLPAGYRYIRPGGNMSEIAGTAEAMSLGIEATLNQLKRLDKTYREIAGVSRRGAAVARENIAALNAKAVEQMERYDAYVQGEARDLGSGELERLQTRFNEQQQVQQRILTGNADYVRMQEEYGKNDLNWFLNDSARQTGMAEEVRNKALLEKPEFVGANEQGQLARLQKDLAKYQQQPANQPQLQTDLNLPAGDVQALTGGRSMNGVVAEEDVAAILNSVALENTAQMQRDASQVMEQLNVLEDNRAQRYFKVQSMMQMPAQSKAAVQPPAGEPQAPATRAPAAAGTVPGQALGLNSFGEGLRGGYGGAVTVGAAPADGGVVHDAVHGPAVQDEGGAYVSAGVYSLPVSLPDGGVRQDYARPGGEAALTLWAVPEATLRNVRMTLVLLAAAVIAGVAIWLWSRVFTALRPRRAIGFGALLVVLTILLGIVGFVASLVIIAIVQLCWKRHAIAVN